MNSIRTIKSIKENFKRCDPYLSKNDLGINEMTKFLEEKNSIEEKIKSLDLKSVEIEELKEIDKVK